ncbi:FecCD family ABC transporter permease [Desulfuribacillus alkaliarsenatis]|uniref:Iron ABC transporter permease n=1 Tax=Desulfuribacillus alkaliarsenatis TaxID=766136 RepID=A0A1E5G4M5_9FIRM|nr:iron ABC transporter permease [Desulfuribacillus alkaliarsenatis]OEF98127.1 iron ABC transporter permease [Desulfuribacillus alkaliarsenatis]
MKVLSVVKPKGKRMNPLFMILILLSITLVSMFISINMGYTRIPVQDILRTLVGLGTFEQNFVIFDARLPRIVIAVLVGAGFAVSGAIMQGVSQNGLADPGILGLNAGAGFAVVLYISLFHERIGMASAFALPIFAFLGAAITAAIVFVLSLKRGTVDPIRLVLMGVAVGSGIGALMLFSTYYMGSYQYEFVKIWLTGSIWGTNWAYVGISFVWLSFLLPLAIYKARTLNVMNLGELVATGVGAYVTKERIILITIAVALAAVCVSVAGSIGFVGLIAPHLARQLVGVNHKIMVPTAALSGGILVLIADMIGRILVHPVEIPVGVVVAGIGAPYFLYLLIKTK